MALNVNMGSSTEVVETRKRKRLSKNKKKNWRKTNVDDVEEFLEDKRLQERTGGLVAEKTDNALFFVDKAAKKIHSKKDEPAPSRKRTRKPLRCHALLEPDSNINVVKAKRSARKEPPQKKLKAEKQSQKVQYRKRKDDDFEIPVVQKDLWANPKEEEEVEAYYLQQTKQKATQPPRHHLTKTSVVPSVEVPHPGASYNPLYEEYQELLMKAHEIEKQKEKKELRIKRALDDQITKVTVKQVQDRWMQEMSTGINDDDLSKDEDDTVDDNDRLSVNPPIRREDKKTERQRRKERDRQAKEQVLATEKANNLRKREIYSLKRLKSEVVQKMLALKKRQEMKAVIKQKAITKPKKLGKLKYEEPELEIKLSEELPDSLRRLKPEGHLLEDRLKSFQKRNIIEPRQKAKNSRRYKRKTYIKKSHKEAADLIKKA